MMLEKEEVPDRKIIIEGYANQLKVTWRGYPDYLKVIMELQMAIDVVRKKIQEQSIIVPSSKIVQ